MSTRAYAVVKVTFQNGKLVCDPDWVHLYWETGPADIRWVFNAAPANAVGAVVEFLAVVPSKYSTVPEGPGGFQPRGVHRGMGSAQASTGSRLPDIVTSGNTQESGYFYYDVKLLDANGGVVAQADPGGDNDPIPPN